MSLILDALKRAERERRHLLPSLADPDPSALPPPGHRRRTRLKLALAVGAVLALVALAAWFLRRPGALPEPVPPQAPPAAAAREPAPVIAAPTPGPTPAAPAPVVIPGTEGMVSLDELASADAGLPPVAELAPSAPVAPVAATPARPAVAAPPAPAASVEPEPTAAAPKAEPAPPPALTQPAPLRRFREMTPEYRADFPAITIEVHVHESSVARRWVMVNGRRYKQGERLAEGPALLEIVPEGVVLEYRGEKLLYPLSR